MIAKIKQENSYEIHTITIFIAHLLHILWQLVRVVSVRALQLPGHSIFPHTLHIHTTSIHPSAKYFEYIQNASKRKEKGNETDYYLYDRQG